MNIFELFNNLVLANIIILFFISAPFIFIGYSDNSNKLFYIGVVMTILQFITIAVLGGIILLKC